MRRNAAQCGDSGASSTAEHRWGDGKRSCLPGAPRLRSSSRIGDCASTCRNGFRSGSPPRAGTGFGAGALVMEGPEQAASSRSLVGTAWNPEQVSHQLKLDFLYVCGPGPPCAPEHGNVRRPCRVRGDNRRTTSRYRGSCRARALGPLTAPGIDASMII